MSILCETLTIEPVNIYVLTAIELVYKITPDDADNQTLTYTSSNPEIATVNDTGIVTGISVGSTEIIVETTDGSNLSVTVPVNILGEDFIPCTSLYIEPFKVTIFILDVIQLVSTITPSNATNQKLTYTSRNPEIATVNDTGIITGISSGNTEIIVKTTDGSNIPFVLTVNIIVYCEKLTIEPSSIKNIQPGLSAYLISTITPDDATNQKLTYTSSNPKIATVNNNGMVKGISVGSTEVIVKTTDGSNISVTVPVDVLQQFIRCKRLDINPYKITMVPELQPPVTLVTKILPANSTNKTLAYSSYDTEIAIVTTKGIIKGISPGFTQIDVITLDGSNIISYVPVTILDSFNLVNGFHSGIVVSEISYNMIVNKTLQLVNYVIPLPDGAKPPAKPPVKLQGVQWYSSDNSIATVTQTGLVKAIKLGNAVITSKSIYNSKYVPSYLAYFNINVE
jgi:uncharacterized protein YjdB